MGEATRHPRLVVGCMTGTSIDALDCALVRIIGEKLEIHAEVVRCASADLGPLRDRLRSLAEGNPATAGEIAAINSEFGQLHAVAVHKVAGGEHIDLVCVHGQTVFHRPPLSWQLMNPWPIVRAVGAPVVFDLRGADLAFGGQGAPITPIADAILLRRHPELRLGFAVVNLGGFANATIVPASSAGDAESWIQSVRGFDICVCNQLLDRIARDALYVPFDDGGRIAMDGAVHAAECSALMSALKQQRSADRSLGSGDEAGVWLAGAKPRMHPADLAATACEAIGRAIMESCRGTPNLLLAGGGSKNVAVVRAILRAAGCTAAVTTIDRFGISAEYREAIEFAVLGVLCQDKVPISLPGVTRVPVPAPLGGAWAFPG